MNARTISYALIACIISGCATYRPIVDMAGVDQSQYERDIIECQGYAGGVDPAGQAIGGALIGGIFASLLGAALCGRDCARTGAAVGVVQGAGAGAAESTLGQVGVIKNCMSGRGYKVLR